MIVLGHDLRKLTPNCTGDLFFVSPILVRTADSSKSEWIFDSDVHGYHGEMQSSAKIRGSGQPEQFICKGCHGTTFLVTAVIG